MTQKDDVKLSTYTEALSDDEVQLLIDAAVDCDLIKKGEGLDKLHVAFDKSENDDQKAELYRVLGNIAIGAAVSGKAGEYLEKARGLAKSDDVVLKVKTDIATYYSGMEKHGKAAAEIEDAVKLATTKDQKGTTLATKARIVSAQGNYKEAIKLFEKAAKLYKSIESHAKHAEIRLAVGDVHASLGDVASANDAYREALRFAQKTKGAVSLTPIFFRLGNMLMELGRYTPAMTYFEDCLKDRSQPHFVVRSLRNLAECYSRIGGEEDAGKFHQRAVKQAIALKDEAEIAISRDAYAAFLIADGQLEKAIKELEESYNVRKEYFRRTGNYLEGVWEFAEVSYRLHRVLELESKKAPEPVETHDTEGIKLSGSAAVDVRHLIDLMQYTVERPKILANRYDNLTLKEAVKQFKKEFLGARLEMVNWDKNKLAKQMGVTLSNLYHHLESLGMNK